jgi:Fur family peroxide stress response transcriptional regulator
MTTYQHSDTSAIQALRSKGYKATPQRIAICRFVLSSRDHPCAQQVYNQVKKIHTTVSLATVYKTLQVLKNLNLIQELNLPQGQARFDSYMKPHINLVCLQCGNIVDLDDTTSIEITRKVVAAAKFKPKGQRIDIFGTCRECSVVKQQHARLGTVSSIGSQANR